MECFTYSSVTYTYLFVQHCPSEFLITFEAWAKLAQQWLVCAPLVIHLEPINKDTVQNMAAYFPTVEYTLNGDDLNSTNGDVIRFFMTG